MNDKGSLEQIRMRARSLAERAGDDPALMAQLQSNPAAVLASADIPEELTGEFLQAMGIEADVTGYIGHIKILCVLTEIL